MARRKKKSGPKPVEALHHKDKRANIPTEELRSFVAEAEEGPPTLLYPRDPSLDPQLVWRGKDEQDREDLAVPVVPVYIQEKVHPQALIENLRDTAVQGEDEPEQLLFADFNGLEGLEKKLDFYKWERNWANRMILGDSLLVMTSLAEKEGLKGKVQMIYVDPPYGIKFGSNWQVSTRKRDVKDGKVTDASREPEVVKAFRDTWELGIHSYLSYLRDRFVVARELLTESGSIFVQIGDENVHLVRAVMDEVFGSENFVSIVTFSKTGSLATGQIANVSDHLLWYARARPSLKYRELNESKVTTGVARAYSWVELPTGERRGLKATERIKWPRDARRYQPTSLVSSGRTATGSSSVTFAGREFAPPANSHWKTTTTGLNRLVKANRVVATPRSLRYVRYLGDYAVSPLTNIWTGIGLGSFTEPQRYVVQTAPTVTERCLLMTTDPGDLVLDPTCGSGTTAYVAEQWGRRWITMDTSRVALALARTRLMAAKYPYYLLADSEEGAAREVKVTSKKPSAEGPAPRYEKDVRKGFVYRRVPHITLKAIANNEEIDEIWERFQENLEPLRAQLNEATAESWEEWEIPREADDSWPEAAQEAHQEWWKLRRERQDEIDASIARFADQELLVDQPYEDKKTLRVTGPFTVESLSPHRVLAAEEERPAAEREGQRDPSGPGFESMILDNLRKAGVQNTRKAERLSFDTLEPFPGTWIQAAGDYTDAEGKSRRIAVSLGPEHGTVGQKQVEEAAKEAVLGVGFDVLLVLGFAFDARAGEKAREISPEKMKPEDGFVAEAERQYGRLPVLLVRMNPDLSMGDELLKKTGAGNLFMVFGEPDVQISRNGGGRLTVTLRGLDVYDPTTGEIRSSATDDIACWFVDTAYDGESFFVRHAYFTGAGDPYLRLRKALRAEIDREAWDSLYRTESRPFDPPKTGKIAVKVINHYGDEVLKVYDEASWE